MGTCGPITHHVQDHHVDPGQRRRGIDAHSPPWVTDCNPGYRLHRRPSSSSSVSFGRDSVDLERTIAIKSDTDADLADADKPFASASSPSSSPDPLRPYLRNQPKSLSGIAIRSFSLGIALAASATATFTLLLYAPSPLWRVPFFIASLSLFHFLEFWTTAAYNTPAAQISSFLLTANWPAYAIAHGFATFECLLTNLIWPDSAWAPAALRPVLILAGLVLVVIGQTVRSVAMIHAGRSFNHTVQYRRKSSHVLVTDGIYSVLRHPSYFGFFWWALGTQLVMGNVLSFMGYAGVLWKFFSTRIEHEEEYLVAFFGAEYVDYRARVGTKIPFVW